MTELARSAASQSIAAADGIDRKSLLFLASAVLFRIGLALVTFEQDRPFGIMLSDYCFFASLLLLFSWPRYRWIKGTGVLPSALLILSGAVLSLLYDQDLTGAAGPLAKLFTLFVLFAPLAVVHAKAIRKNMIWLIAGICGNCTVTLLQAWFFPNLVASLSINPQTPDQSDILRFQGLTEFPVTLGLSAALAVVVGVGLLLSERRTLARSGLILLVLICTIAGLLSGSRTFLVAAIPGLLALAVLQKNRRRKAVHAIVAVGAIWLVVGYLAPSAVSQFEGRLDTVGFIDYGRVAVAVQAALDIAQKPILGWGINHFNETGLVFLPDINDYQPAHVTLLQYWYGAGMLGAIGFVSLFVVPIRRMVKIVRGNPSRYTNAVSVILASYASFIVIFSLGPYVYNRFLYIPMFVFSGFAAYANVPVPPMATQVAGFGDTVRGT